MRVETKRLVVRADRAIVAIPPVLAGRIRYSPGLPDSRRQLIRGLPQGTLLKVTAVLRPPVLARQGPQRHGGVA